MNPAMKLLALLVLSLAALGARAQEKVVYHFDSGLERTPMASIS